MYKYQWRITKYNPNFRDARGAYLREDWTSLYDIEKIYNQEVFTITEYSRVEEMYVEAIIYFLDSLALDSVQIIDLYRNKDKLVVKTKYASLYTEKMFELYRTVCDEQFVGKDEVVILSKLALREDLGLKFYFNKDIFVHFGYDYYMYIGTNQRCSKVVEFITRLGLFIEYWISPYHQEEEQKNIHITTFECNNSMWFSFRLFAL